MLWLAIKWATSACLLALFNPLKFQVRMLFMILDGVSPQRFDRKDLIMNFVVGLVFYSNINEHCVRIRNWELTTLFNVLTVPTHLSLLQCLMWLAPGFIDRGALTF